MAGGNEYSKQSEHAASASAELSPEVIPVDPAPAYEVASPSTSASTPAAAVPTVNSPFNFPKTSTAPPEYSDPASGPSSSSSSSSSQRPIAFPQAQPDGASPFISAYAPVLLRHGVTEETWRSFLDTVSAFLTAKVSDRAVHHAADMAQHLGQAPKSFGKGVASHARAIGRDVADNAKQGNIIGAAMGVIAGVVSFPVVTALGAAGTVLALPTTALGAITKRPRTPLERAATYVTVANGEWLHARGLHAQLANTSQLARLMGLSGGEVLKIARGAAEADATGQLRALEPHMAALEVQLGTALRLEAQTLWLVLIQRGLE